MEHRAHGAAPPEVLPGPERQEGLDGLTPFGQPPEAAVEDAFDTIAARCRGVLYRTAQLTRSPRDAAGLLEETYRRARRSLHPHGTSTNPKAWLLRILYHAHIDRLKTMSHTLGIPLSRLCGGRRAIGRLLARHGPRTRGSANGSCVTDAEAHVGSTAA